MDRFSQEFAPNGMIWAAAVALACLICLALAYWIRSRADESFGNLTVEIIRLKIKGKTPTKDCGKIKKQHQRVECERRRAVLTINYISGLFLMFGFVAPLIFLVIFVGLDGVIFANGHHIFQQTGSGAPISADITQKTLFALDEAAHVVTDAISDTFHWSITGLSRNETKLTFSLYLSLFFRLVCGGFFVSSVILMWRALTSLAPQNIPYLEELKQSARNHSSCDLGPVSCPVANKGAWKQVKELLLPRMASLKTKR